MAIQASPNPIIVPLPANVGSTTITWDAQGGTGRVSIKIDAQAEVFFDPLIGQPLAPSGSKALSLGVGQTAVLTVRQAGNTPIGPSLTVTAIRPAVPGGIGGDFKSTVGNGLDQVYQIDQFQLIRDVSVKAGPTSVRIRFSTVFPTVPIVEVFRKLTKHPQLDMVVANRVAESFPVFGGNQTIHDVRLRGLDQDSQFWYKITAYGGPLSDPSIVVDDFLTGRRRATLFIDEIKVFNSGDPWGTGEMAFLCAVFDTDKEVLLGNQHRHPDSGEEDVKSGSSISLPFGSPVEVIENAPDNLGVYVEGWDTDIPFGPSGVSARGEKFLTDSLPTSGHGEDDYITWAGLLFAAELPDFSTSIPLDIDPGNWGVHYTMLGRIDVEIFQPMEIHQSASTLSPDTSFVKHMGKAIGVGDIETGVQHLTLGPEGKVLRRIVGRNALRSRKALWEEIGGPRMVQGFAVVSSPRGRVDLFGRGENDRVAHAFWNVGADKEQVKWVDLGGQIFSDVRPIRLGEGKLGLFALGENGAAHYARIGGDQRADSKIKWQNLGGKFSERFAAAASPKGPIHLFGVNPDGAVFHTSLPRDSRSNGAGKWISLGGKFAGPVVAQSIAKGVVVFALGADRMLFGKSWNGRKWTPSGAQWVPLGCVDCFSVPKHVKAPAKKKARKKN